MLLRLGEIFSKKDHSDSIFTEMVYIGIIYLTHSAACIAQITALSFSEFNPWVTYLSFVQVRAHTHKIAHLFFP